MSKTKRFTSICWFFSGTLSGGYYPLDTVYSMGVGTIHTHNTVLMDSKRFSRFTFTFTMQIAF